MYQRIIHDASITDNNEARFNHTASVKVFNHKMMECGVLNLKKRINAVIF